MYGKLCTVGSPWLCFCRSQSPGVPSTPVSGTQEVCDSVFQYKTAGPWSVIDVSRGYNIGSVYGSIPSS